MNAEVKNRLIERARAVYRHIRPCSGLGTLDECFTRLADRYVFWFNTPDHSTHCVMELVRGTNESHTRWTQ